MPKKKKKPAAAGGEEKKKDAAAAEEQQPPRRFQARDPAFPVNLKELRENALPSARNDLRAAAYKAFEQLPTVRISADWFTLTQIEDAFEELGGEEASDEIVLQRALYIASFHDGNIFLPAGMIAWYCCAIRYNYPLPTGYMRAVTVAGKTFSSYGTGILMQVPPNNSTPLAVMNMWLPQRQEVGMLMMSLTSKGVPQRYYGSSDVDTLEHIRKVLRRSPQMEQKVLTYNALPLQTVLSFADYIRACEFKVNPLSVSKFFVHIEPAVAMPLLFTNAPKIFNLIEQCAEDIHRAIRSSCLQEAADFLLKCAERKDVPVASFRDLTMHFPNDWEPSLRHLIGERKKQFKEALRGQDLKDPRVQQEIRNQTAIIKMHVQNFDKCIRFADMMCMRSKR